jgi:hypothetical protein
MLVPTIHDKPESGGRAAQPELTQGPALWPSSARDEEIWLLGQPPLSRLLDFVEETAIDGATFDRAALTTEWRVVNDHYQALEKTEAGIANQGTHRELDPGLSHLASLVEAHPRFRRAFDTLPTRIEMVDLDHLIVCQRHVTRHFVEACMARIKSAADPAALFGLCLPLDDPHTPVKIQKVGSHRYVFRCESTDFRFHEVALLRPDQLSGYDSVGAVAGIVGLVVGFGPNFLNAVRVGKRVLLNNGYHRAVALRAAGLTHAPCIVQTATRVDELAVTVKSRVAEDPEFYFESARPPLIQDFFNARIRKLIPIRKRARLVEVSFEFKDHLLSE